MNYSWNRSRIDGCVSASECVANPGDINAIRVGREVAAEETCGQALRNLLPDLHVRLHRLHKAGNGA